MGSYIVENAKKEYGQGADGVLYRWKCKNKVRPRYSWVFLLFKK